MRSPEVWSDQPSLATSRAPPRSALSAPPGSVLPHVVQVREAASPPADLCSLCLRGPIRFLCANLLKDYAKRQRSRCRDRKARGFGKRNQGRKTELSRTHKHVSMKITSLYSLDDIQGAVTKHGCDQRRKRTPAAVARSLKKSSVRMPSWRYADIRVSRPTGRPAHSKLTQRYSVSSRSTLVLMTCLPMRHHIDITIRI